jgi:hypothetical protein
LTSILKHIFRDNYGFSLYHTWMKLPYNDTHSNVQLQRQKGELLSNGQGPSWPWSYGSWIYNYQCNQWLSPLTLWVRIQLRRYEIKLVSDLRQVGCFSPGFLQHSNWNIVNIGIKRHKPNLSNGHEYLPLKFHIFIFSLNLQGHFCLK